MYQKDMYLDWIVLAFKELLLLNCSLMASETLVKLNS